MTEDEAVRLTYWRDFLTAQSAQFNSSIIEQTGTSYVADEVKAAFLLIDEEIANDEIEKAVEAFIHDTSWPCRWPPMKPRECLHLDFRAYLGLAVISDIVRETPAGMIIKERVVPELGNFRSGVRWFFLHFWKMGGKVFLAAMADDFIKNGRGEVS
jgi:hypothetical protein